MDVQTVHPRGWHECVVAATGPSLTPAVAEACRGQRVIAVNDAYRLFPWADVLYGGDRDWWELHNGVPEFAGEKWSAHEPKLNDKSSIADKYGLHLVAGPRQVDAPGFSLSPSRIHYGNSSGFQAINLALLFGATRVLLVGFDMRTPPAGQPRHFFGDHARADMNLATYEHFLPAFAAAARTLPKHIHILNCTPRSALRVWPVVTLESALHTRELARAAEEAKYVRAYSASEYRMGAARMADTLGDLADLPRGSLLDVGCGRGELLEQAHLLGFGPVSGTEVVPQLVGGDVLWAEAHALPFPDKSYDVVTLCDVIEHLVPGDDEAACRELARVARRAILVTANNGTSQRATGEELHINRRGYDDWDRLFRLWFPGKVNWLNQRPREHASQAWRVDL